MAAGTAAWGVEVGQCALKAIKLRPAEEGAVELAAFDVIEHPKILSQPDADRDELIKAALEKFVSRNDWQGDKFVIGVPGQQTFSRFCKLPPVDAKKIPDIVRFEASQQIPFDMDDVVWDYQVFQTKDMPEVEVGIFAMRKDLVRQQLDYYTRVGIVPIAIQTIPSALFNFCRFDVRGGGEQGAATVVIDVGAQHTDLVIVEPNSAWMRNIPLGGNNFTEALVKAFKLSFHKAEQLKRTAATSKYARQIFQAMRPVFSDLVAEIQRSLGFYAQTHREVELKRVLACGNAFRLPGLQKYLENNLTIGTVVKLEKFDRLITTATSNAPQFTENLLSFGPAYGLALQGLALATISANLLPPELARVQRWNRKRPYFIAAAACLGLAATFPWLRNSLDQQALAVEDQSTSAKQIVERAKNALSRFNEVAKNTEGEQKKIERLFELHKDRPLVPRIIALVHEALPEVDPQIEAARTPEELKKLVESNPERFKRTRRKQIIIESFNVTYAEDINTLERKGVQEQSYAARAGRSFGGEGGMRGGGEGGGEMPYSRGAPTEETEDAAAAKGPAAPGFYVHLRGRLLYGELEAEAAKLVFEEFYPRLRQVFQTPGLGFWMPEEDPKGPDKQNLPQMRLSQAMPPGTGVPAWAPGQPVAEAVAGAPQQPSVLVPDPATGEEMAKDWLFEVGFKLKLGEPPKDEKKKND